MNPRAIPYSQHELNWVSKNRTLPIQELHSDFCKLFNRNDVSATHLSALRKRNGWKTGRTGRFVKGNIPLPNARPGGPNNTSFKKGNRPHNWKPIGSSRISKDGYVEVKISEPKTWAQLHVIIWQATNGTIPDGHCVVFKDMDKTNICLDNLELITRNENLQINRLRCSSRPQEIKPVVRTIGKLIAKTSEMNTSSKGTTCQEDGHPHQV